MNGGPVIYTRRRVRDRLLALLASDSVRNFIWLYYFWFIVGSVQLTFFDYPVGLIVDPMGLIVYDAWAWMPLFACPVALAGLVLRYGGSPADEIRGRVLRRDFLGLYMQVGGHGCMAVVIAIFIGTAIYGEAPGQPVPSASWLCAYLMGVAFLTAQSYYKVRLARRYR